MEEAPEEQPFYVNAKQYHRILKRRIARARLDESLKSAPGRKPYLHESRHKHAMRRPRGQGGRFLTAAEIAEMAKKEKEEKQATGADPNGASDTSLADTSASGSPANTAPASSGTACDSALPSEVKPVNSAASQANEGSFNSTGLAANETVNYDANASPGKKDSGVIEVDTVDNMAPKNEANVPKANDSSATSPLSSASKDSESHIREDQPGQPGDATSGTRDDNTQ